MLIFVILGDCKSNIYLWEFILGGKWVVEKILYMGYFVSVEDL